MIRFWSAIDIHNNVIRHRGVDLSRQFDEAGIELILPRLPCQVKGIDGDAVAAQPRAGIEGLEAEGFGLGGFDNLPDVDVHPVEEHLEFVDHRDVDGAIDVLQELAESGDTIPNSGEFGSCPLIPR